MYLKINRATGSSWRGHGSDKCRHAWSWKKSQRYGKVLRHLCTSLQKVSDNNFQKKNGHSFYLLYIWSCVYIIIFSFLPHTTTKKNLFPFLKLTKQKFEYIKNMNPDLFNDVNSMYPYVPDLITFPPIIDVVQFFFSLFCCN